LSLRWQQLYLIVGLEQFFPALGETASKKAGAE